MNVLKTVIVAPMSSKDFDFVFRPKIKFEKKDGLVLLGQIRTVDKTRLVKNLEMYIKKYHLLFQKCLYKCLNVNYLTHTFKTNTRG